MEWIEAAFIAPLGQIILTTVLYMEGLKEFLRVRKMRISYNTLK